MHISHNSLRIYVFPTKKPWPVRGFHHTRLADSKLFFVEAEDVNHQLKISPLSVLGALYLGWDPAFDGFFLKPKNEAQQLLKSTSSTTVINRAYN